MSRWKAASIHLGISAMIALGVVAALFLVWYPPPLFQASGLEQFLIILLGVDVVVGPLLTLIVFRASKPEIRTDMTVIALAQIVALIYGLHVMWQARPVFLVAAVDRFQVITATDLLPEHLDQAAGTPYQSLPLFGAEVVGARGPTDLEEKSALREEVIAGARDFDFRPQYYVPYAEVAEDLAKRGRPLGVLLEHAPRSKEHIDKLARAAGESVESLRFVPVKTPRRFISALLTSRGNLIGMIDADPWVGVGATADPTPKPD